MPEPTVVDVLPAIPRVGKKDPNVPTVGDKYKKELARLEQEQQTQKSSVQPVESAPEKASEDEATQPTPKTPPIAETSTPKESAKAVTPASKPSSALEAAMGEPKPVAPPEDKLPDKLEGATDKVNENWSKARAKIDKLEAELKSRSAAPPQDNGQVQLQKDYDALKARYEDQENRLKGINAEYSDEYRSLLQDRDKTLGKIAREVKASGADPASLIDALQLPDSKFRRDQIKEALSTLDDEDKTTVKAMMVKLAENDDAISDFRKDLPGQWDQISNRREQQMQKDFQENIKTLETAFVKFSDESQKSTVTLRLVPDDVDGAEDWNKEIRSARDVALNALKPNGADINKTMDIALKGARYDSLEARYLALHKDYSELKARHKEEDTASPDFRGTKAPAPRKDEPGSKKYHKILAQLESAQEE